MRAFVTQRALVALFLCLHSAILTTAQTGPPPPPMTEPPFPPMTTGQMGTWMPYPMTTEEEDSEKDDKGGMVYWVNGQIQVNGLGFVNGKAMTDMLLGGDKIKEMEKKLDEMKGMSRQERMGAMGKIVWMILDTVKDMKMDEGSDEIEGMMEQMEGMDDEQKKGKMEEVLVEMVKQAMEMKVEGEEEDMEKMKEMVKEMKKKYGEEKEMMMWKIVKMIVWKLKQLKKFMMIMEIVEMMKGGEGMEMMKMNMLKMKMMDKLEEMKGDMEMGEKLEKVRKIKELRECIETLRMLDWMRMKEEEEMGRMMGLWGGRGGSLFEASGAERVLPLSLALSVLTLCTRTLFF